MDFLKAIFSVEAKFDIDVKVKKANTAQERYYKKLQDIIELEDFVASSLFIKSVKNNEKEVSELYETILRSSDLIGKIDLKILEMQVTYRASWLNRTYGDYTYNSMRTSEEKEISALQNKIVALNKEISICYTRIDLLQKDNIDGIMVLDLQYIKGLNITLEICTEISDNSKSSYHWYEKGVYVGTYSQFNNYDIKSISVKINKENIKEEMEINSQIETIIIKRVMGLVDHYKEKRILEVEKNEIAKQRKIDEGYRDKYRTLLGLYPMDRDFKIQMNRANKIVGYGNDILQMKREIEKLRDLDYGILDSEKAKNYINK